MTFFSCFITDKFDSLRFKLNVDRVELTLGVSIIQEVAPGTRYSNPGDAEFQSLPDNTPWALVPLFCTNSSAGSVKIDPVYLHPWYIHWSSVNSTQTESPITPHYATISEEFNMTILACMPECVTSVLLTVYLPTRDSVSLVTVDDAYVTFVGSELYNTTLFEGDGKLATSMI